MPAVGEVDEPSPGAPQSDLRDETPGVDDPGATAVPRSAQQGAPLVGARRRRSWVWLVVLPLLGALLLGGAGLVANQQAEPTYAAEALVTVLPTDPAAPVSQPVAGIWVKIGSSDAVLSDAADALDVATPVLASRLELVLDADSPVIAVRVTTADAERSATWANAVAAVLLEQDRGERVPGYELEQVATAVPPAGGSELLSPLLVTAAALFGGLIGLVGAQRLRRRRTT
ncbi:hypothetical protein SAMN05660748_0990 [Blastococcus aggregatus]|uniref:Capsular polysaccharide biosynthesis protein n=1 Tax=Blastococcus aggregatus TaxID=38502 RepID=A0A285V108_9ACTN|nr:hypothetical protein [Blastococcus aggregatus]SOC47733.1 hypothetical protein SAMN05660748_0990 [Blastococcus aggregatus]